MAGDEAVGGEETAPAEEPAPPKRRRALRWVAIGVAGVLVATGGGAFALYQKLQGNIGKERVGDRLGTNRPPKLNKSTNILLLGSDSRDGRNRQYASPDISGERSDTTILLHISPNRDRAVAVSFPRDSMVQVPTCVKRNGRKVPAYFGMINAAFTYGGAPCTWKTIEATTGIHIDHYVKVDFAGFKKVVDALGGVEVCVPSPVDDPRANLRLRAGRQVVKGDAALGYVRTRYGIGDGSDLERIQRQQKFMSSVVKKATGGDLLTNPARTYKVLDAVTKAIDTDDGFSTAAMRKLATGLRGMSTGTVRFATVPTRPYPKDPNRVQWDMAQAGPLFEAIKRDNALPAAKPAPPQARPSPEDVTVTVVGGSKKVAKRLRAQGFHVRVAGGPPQAETQIRYGPGAELRADAVAVAVPGVRLVPDNGMPPGAVSLVVGSAGATVRPAGGTDIPTVNGEINAGQNLCKG